MKPLVFLLLPLCLLSFYSYAQNSQPESLQAVTPYGQTTPQDIKVVMDRILTYVDLATPVAIVNRTTGERISDLTKPVKEATLIKGEYSIASHEWGLLYTGMLLAGEITGDNRYTNYAAGRFEFLGKALPYFRAYKKAFLDKPTLRSRLRI